MKQILGFSTPGYYLYLIKKSPQKSELKPLIFAQGRSKSKVSTGAVGTKHFLLSWNQGVKSVFIESYKLSLPIVRASLGTSDYETDIGAVTEGGEELSKRKQFQISYKLYAIAYNLTSLKRKTLPT